MADKQESDNVVLHPKFRQGLERFNLLASGVLVSFGEVSLLLVLVALVCFLWYSFGTDTGLYHSRMKWVFSSVTLIVFGGMCQALAGKRVTLPAQVLISLILYGGLVLLGVAYFVL
ncbi:hypothetical protein A3D66_00290 [Candidatus Kaiserbacteria bacterium RIFCSPHIGHO2_02_FULL_50_9]|nr:MAG: hypothetical protein A3D66_00290 [Candidatus Kaiserbacteria bacterium RIFCSPHIGHO2_02_FULL_50_9]